MANILISPSKYVQGAGELGKLGAYAEKYGKKALIVITESGYRRVGAAIDASFAGVDTEIDYDYFNGECCKKEINRLIAVMQEKGCDLIVGIGGGKILDTSKAVAYYCKTPVLICPTIASTDAPCSALSVIYTEDGVFEIYTVVDDLYAVKEALEAAGYPITSAEKDKIPSTTVELTDADDLKFMGLLVEMLEEDDDVMNVYHNWENCD